MEDEVHAAHEDRRDHDDQKDVGRDDDQKDRDAKAVVHGGHEGNDNKELDRESNPKELVNL